MSDAASPPVASNDWPSIGALLNADAEDAKIALFGAPLAGGSVTPGRCDLAPEITRKAMRRISTYDIETGLDLATLSIFDAGDVPLDGLAPDTAFAPILDASKPLAGSRELTIMIGGNNAVTRPGVHALDPSLCAVGLLTLDAHFDLRPTDRGLINGNPVKALIDDGLPGAHIAQIGIAPFCNTKAMHELATREGVRVETLGACRRRGVAATVAETLDELASRCDVIYVDFDIDVIDRAAAPGAPGARPDGVSAAEFFEATRLAAAHPKTRMVDLTEFDPWLDVSDMTALIAGRWVAELLAGFSGR